MSHKIYRPILRASEMADNVRTAVRHNSTIGDNATWAGAV